MNEDRNVQPSAHLEHGVELRMVDRNSFAVLVPDVDAEVLEELEPNGTRSHVPLELLRRVFTEP